MCKDKRKEDDFHFSMLQEYISLFKKIETETLFPSIIQSLDHRVKTEEQLDTSEKEAHLTFINKLEMLGEEIKTLHWMSKHLKVLHEFGQTFANTFNKEDIFQKTYEQISKVMDTDAFIIALYKEGDSHFEIPFCVDNGVRYAPRQIPLGQGIISRVIEKKQTIHIRSEREMNQNHQGYITWGNPQQNTQTCIFVPMILNNQIRGVLSVQNYREFAYGSQHEELLRILGIQVASAIETAVLYDRVYELSVKDDLTNLNNNRKFHMDLDKISSTATHDDPISLMMIDSDNLKEVNDRYGHHIGDMLIKHIAGAMLKNIDPKEKIYRYAGDEFMLISYQSDINSLEAKGRAIQEYLREHPLYIQGEKIVPTVSIGIARYPYDTDSTSELKRLADKAMYISKHSGKNRMTIYCPMKHEQT